MYYTFTARFPLEFISTEFPISQTGLSWAGARANFTALPGNHSIPTLYMRYGSKKKKLYICGMG
jgi:hypothetical protein